MPSKGTVHGERITVLDGLRGIAVLWVVMYHYAVFWTPAGHGQNLTPYDEMFAWIPLADVGHFGVNLFFLISGYVISLTLERTSTLSEFAVKRIARLWPALIICGTLTYAITTSIGPSELRVSFTEYVISLLFLPPQHVGNVLGVDGWSWLDGAYWSLWVEVRFYAVIGGLFYVFKSRFVELWIGFELTGWAFHAANFIFQTTELGLAEGLLFSTYTPYFTLGMVTFQLHAKELSKAGWVAATVALAHLAFLAAITDTPFSLSQNLGALTVAVLFGTFVFAPHRLSILNGPSIQTIGQASYTFYLIHQAAGLSLMVALAAVLPASLTFLIFPGVFVAMIFLSVSLSDCIEKPGQTFLLATVAQTRQIYRQARRGSPVK